MQDTLAAAPHRRLLLAALALLLALGLVRALAAAQTPAAPGHAVRLDVAGPIGPAVADYINRSLEDAAAGGAHLVILRMDTPGGLDASMRTIIQDILASPVPVATYVAPSGARAASAGTYILYASHIAAMAPATNLGAATPVQIGSGGGLPDLSEGDPAAEDQPAAEEKPAEPADSGDAMTHKMVNDAVALIRGLAKEHGRNADWAEQAVREAASLEAREALEQNVIDLVAADVADLLAQIDGREVQVRERPLTLETQGLEVREQAPDWRSELLAVITDPNIAYILMLIGIYGLIFEMANPGSILPGTVGAICLLLALFALQVLPINYAGLGLLLLGIALMVGEAFAPSFGVLGIGGVAAFVIGSVILIDTDAPGYGISLGLIGAVALFSAVLLFVVLGLIFKARRRPVVSGSEEMVGSSGKAAEAFEGEGHVRIHGELWRARSKAPLQKGQPVRVTHMDGLTLEVEPQSDN